MAASLLWSPPPATAPASSQPRRHLRCTFLAPSAPRSTAAGSGAVKAAARQGEAAASGSQAEAAATPLLDAVLERGGRAGDVPFHVPGHKRGASTPPGLHQLLGGALRYDLTELDGLDVLSTPSGPIAAAQRAAAATWGADATWFLVNGTTVGIHAAVLATCGPGEALVVARNAHLSAFNAMVLAGCTPVWAQPTLDPDLGLAHAVTHWALEAAFREAAARGLRVGAALVVSPTYFGVLSDVAGLAAVCHAHGVPLLVDEAHGAHLGLHPALPPSALHAGADLAVQSTHKQLSALTQAAMLHVRGGRVPAQRLAHALQVLQSSSPSYLLMASLDAARAQAAQHAAHKAGLAAAALARRRLAALPGVRLLSAEHVSACSGAGDGAPSSGKASSSAGGSASGNSPDSRSGGGSSSSSPDSSSSSPNSSSTSSSSPNSSSTSSSSSSNSTATTAGGVALDPLRLTLDLRGLGLSGYQAAAALEQQHGIVPELSTPTCVVLALSMGSRLEHAEALVAAVERLCQQHGAGSSGGSSSSCSVGSADDGDDSRSTSGGSSIGTASSVSAGSAAAPAAAAAAPEARLTPRNAFFAASEAVPAAQAVGRVSAELLCPYPPGVPVAYPGEVLTEAALQQLRQVLRSGGIVTGCSDGSLETLRVVVER
ncbi:hypothetical protein ABPG75_005243 [Micractinium tetrahymenae]